MKIKELGKQLHEINYDEKVKFYKLFKKSNDKSLN
jgi:hypothetical protein